MSDIWAPVIAAIGASFLTGIVAFGLDWRQARRSSRDALAARRQAAYGSMLAVSGLLGHTAGTLRITMEIRSGLKEGLDVVTRLRTPLEPVGVMELLRRDLEPLYRAWSELWVVGTREAVQVSNAILDRGIRVVGTATVPGETTNRLKRVVVGERWSQVEVDAFLREIQRLAVVRKRLAEVARRELGVGSVELFYDDEAEGKALPSDAAD